MPLDDPKTNPPRARPVTVDAQLIAIVHDQVESQTKVAAELETLNERVEKLEEQGQVTNDLLKELVTLGKERAARELAADTRAAAALDIERKALEIEAKARELSGEAKLKLVEANTEERKVWSAWARDTIATPVGKSCAGAIALVVAGAGVALAGWLTGRFGGGP